jgi:UDPglucose 6-dehydrogenase
MPGSCEHEIIPVLEAESGKCCGIDFGICYNPEFIAIGKVVSDMLTPDIVLIGQSDLNSGEILAGIYNSVCENKPSIVRMNLINAEITKIAINTYITMKISYANALAEICEKMSGADASIVSNAVGLDSRIGQKCLSPALGFGGPCFPRDTIAFAKMSEDLGLIPSLSRATDEVNNRQVKRISNFIMENLLPEDRIAFLGLSYRSNTGMVEKSQALEIARKLAEYHKNITVYDPRAIPEVKAVLKDKVAYADSAKSAINESTIAIIATPWDEFRILNYENLRLVIDCWNIVETSGKTSVLRLGKNINKDNKR